MVPGLRRRLEPDSQGASARYEVLKWGGTLYILSLAWCFFRSSAMAAQHELKPLSFFGGFVSLSLHPKVHSMILAMFSQFLNPALPLVAPVTQIALAVVLVGFSCHFVWIYGGQILFSRIKTQAALRVQGIAFGMCMILVAAFVAFS